MNTDACRAHSLSYLCSRCEKKSTSLSLFLIIYVLYPLSWPCSSLLLPLGRSHLPRPLLFWFHLEPLSSLTRGTLIPSLPTSTRWFPLSPNFHSLNLPLPSTLASHPPFGKLPLNYNPTTPNPPSLPQILTLAPWINGKMGHARLSTTSFYTPSLMFTPPTLIWRFIIATVSTTINTSSSHRGDKTSMLPLSILPKTSIAPSSPATPLSLLILIQVPFSPIPSLSMMSLGSL